MIKIQIGFLKYCETFCTMKIFRVTSVVDVFALATQDLA